MPIFQTISSKQKFCGLLVGIALLYVLAWKGALSNTNDLYAKYRSNKSLIISSASASSQIAQHNAALSSINKNLNRFAYNREKLFANVNELCDEHQLSLKHFMPEHKEESKDYVVITNPLKVEGTFKDILQFVYEMEQVKNLGNVASLEFEKYEDRRTKHQFLQATLYLQNIQTSAKDKNTNDKNEI